MGISYTIDRQQRCIFTKISDPVGDWELAAAVERIWADPEFDPAFARLLDCTDVTEPNASPELWRAIARDFRSRTLGKLGVVATSNIMRRMACIYSCHLKPADVAVFRSRQAALRWLGVRDIDKPGRQDAESIPADARV